MFKADEEFQQDVFTGTATLTLYQPSLLYTDSIIVRRRRKNAMKSALIVIDASSEV